MTVAKGSSSWRARSRARPSSLGITRSVITTEGRAARAFARASSPSAASSTECPQPDTRLASPWREASSSSTTRILTLIFPSLRAATTGSTGRSTRRQAAPQSRVPAREHGVGRQDDLIAPGPGGDQAERHAAELGQAVQILAGLGRQVAVVPEPLGGTLPSRHLLVHGLRLVPDPFLLGKIGEDVAAVPIADADVHGLARVQH